MSSVGGLLGRVLLISTHTHTITQGIRNAPFLTSTQGTLQLSESYVDGVNDDVERRYLLLSFSTQPRHRTKHTATALACIR